MTVTIITITFFVTIRADSNFDISCSIFLLEVIDINGFYRKKKTIYKNLGTHFNEKLIMDRQSLFHFQQYHGVNSNLEISPTRILLEIIDFNGLHRQKNK